MPIYKPSSRRKTASAEKPQSLDLTITDLSDDGRGLSNVDGKKVFVDGALPGEDVVATVIKSHRNYIEAKTRKVQKLAVDRLQPNCPVFKQCGGCSVQYMPHEQQLAFKQQAVLSQLSRWADVRPEKILPPVSGQSYGYRQRVRLAVDYARNDDLFMGFRESGSRRLVNINECSVLVEPLSCLLPLLRQWLLALPPRRVSHIEMIGTAQSSGVLIRHTRPLSVDQRQVLVALLESQHPQVDVWFQGGKKGRNDHDALPLESAAGERVDPRLDYQLNDIHLSFHPQDFIQSNAEVNQAMVKQALDLLQPQADEHVLDLFCGMGNFSLPLARYAKRVTAVEGVESMVVRGRDNALSNHIENIEFMAKDLSDEQSLASLSGLGRIDAMLLDPPRSGAKIISQQIMKLNPKRIVYVSCDSATFARDAGVLAEQGYRLTDLGVIDMFPQTPHIEVMGKFVRSC